MPVKTEARTGDAMRPQDSGRDSLAGVRKAAILLVTMGEDAASEVLRNLSDDEAELITRQIATLGRVDSEEVEGVIRDFQDVSAAQGYLREGGTEYARRLIEKSFPQGKAHRLMELIEAKKHDAPFSFLKTAEADGLFTFLQEEHPQTVALVLSYIESSKAADILSRMPPERQYDIVKRVATLDHTSPEAIKHVEGGLRRHLSSLGVQEFQEVGGVKAVAEMLNVMDRSSEKLILASLEEERPELAMQVKNLMFVFEDLLLVDERGIQNILKEIDNRQLAMALKTASEELKEKIFKNMSQRAADLTREEMSYLGPVRVSDVEAAQQAIVEVVRRLEESGDVIIAGRAGEGDIIV